MNKIYAWMRLGFCLLCIGFAQSTVAAVGQMLTDYFFQNPADLALVNKQQMILGDLMIAPVAEFNGTALGGTGQARSAVIDSLPYLLADIRLSDKWVVGFNIVPSEYGDLNWPIDSIVAYDSTITKVYYYILGFQSSFQLTDKMTLGLGLHVNYNYLVELDALVGNLGNEINKASAVNKGLDAGLRYKITPKHTFIAAMYTPVQQFGQGTSTLAGVTSHDFQMNLLEAAIVFVGLQHQFSERWFMEEKLYWSNWTVQNNTILKNTTRGTLVFPTNWVDTWSYMLATQYFFTEKIAGILGGMYETNPAPNSTNAIAYPLAPALFFSAGVDFELSKNWRMQLVYGYGFFIPKAVIDNQTSHGSISAYTQAGTLQFSYRL